MKAPWKRACEGRLDEADESKFGTNVIPVQMSRERLSRGYVDLMGELYEPQAFFRRLDALFVGQKIELDSGWQQFATRHPWRRRSRHLGFWLQAFGLMGALMHGVRDRSLRAVYFRQLRQFMRTRPSAVMARAYALRCAIHFHMHQLVRVLKSGDRTLLNTY